MAIQTRHKNPPNKPKKKRKLVLKIPKIVKLALTFILVAGILGGGGLFVYSVATIPAYDLGKLDPDATSKIYDINGQLVANIHGVENRTPVPLDQIPLKLQQAVMAMEDARFYQHHGIDLKGWGRALINTFTGHGLQGGSTITNQLAKMAFLTASGESAQRTPTRKIQEVFITLRLERDYYKDEILEFYLNRIFLGGSAYGAQEAAQYYFNKNVQGLNTAECAMIAGLISAPNAYNPYVSMEKAITKQHEALSNMVRFGFIAEQERQQALSFKIVLGDRKNTASKQTAEYFVSYVRDQVIRILQDQGYSKTEASDTVFKGGLVINSTLDVRMQKAAEKAMDEGIDQWLVPLLDNKDERNAKGVLEPESAIILLDSKTGGVRAMIGGRDVLTDQYNRTVQLIKQQPGSAIKPLTVYGPALERGETASSIIVDEPLYENGTGKAPYPVNYDGKNRGPVTLRYAWQESLNIPAWKIAKKNGIDRMLEFAKRLGISTLVERPINGADDRNLAALAIGGVTNGVIPIEMARAFSAIGNKGVLNDTFAIVDVRDSHGQVLYQNRPQSKVVLSKEVSYMMTDIMQDVVNYGTAHSVRSLGGYSGPVAGKTGTTSFNREAWFVGFTPELSGAVYIGHDDNTTGKLAGDDASPTARGRLPGGSSSYISAGIFGRMMKYISAEVPGASKFYSTRPGNIVGPLAVDKTTGLLAGPSCPKANIIYEEYIKGTEPQSVCPAVHAIDIPAANVASVATVKGLIAGAGYTMTQEAATDEATVNAAVVSIISGLTTDGVTTTVTKVAYTPAVAGNAGTPAGTNGTYTFIVGLSKGAATDTTATLTMTVTAQSKPIKPTGH